MSELVRALSDLGLAKFETFLASGNVVFDDDGRTLEALRNNIENGLSACFGFKVEIFLRLAEDLSTILRQVDALKTADDIAVNVGFIRHEESDQMTAALAPWQSENDRLDVYDGHFIWFSKTKMSDTPFFRKGYSRKSIPTMTVRTYNTIERMVAKWNS